MNPITNSVIHPDAPLLSKIKHYKKRAIEIKKYLDKNPTEWGRFQSEFNQEINGIFRDIMIFEKESMSKGGEEKVYKFKKFFMEKLEKDFSYGDYIRWSQAKPYGYAGDFKMIDDIYENNPKTVGFDRLYDNYMQMSAIAIAVRNRKNDFKRIIENVIKGKKGGQVRILDIACGPCQELAEILSESGGKLDGVMIDCLDNDENALNFSRKRLGDLYFSFIKYNAVKLALKKNIEQELVNKYDLIYSTGLFDYLDRRVSIRLIENLSKLLKPGGILAISDVQDQYANPSLHFMQLVGEWDLLYRTHDEFRDIFVESGFSLGQLSYNYEQQGILQYIIARK